MEERLDLAERDLRDHSKSLTVHNDTLHEHTLRITAIEDARRARELVEVRKEERDAARDEALKLRLDTIDRSIGSVQKDVLGIRGAGAKLAWIIITLVVGIIVAFAFKGGFLLS